MSPLTRVAARSVLLGLGAGFGVIVANLPGISLDEGIMAGYAFYTGTLTYAGLATFTDIEPTVGINSKGK